MHSDYLFNNVKFGPNHRALTVTDEWPNETIVEREINELHCENLTSI
jgi:hypothetical protein